MRVDRGNHVYVEPQVGLAAPDVGAQGPVELGPEGGEHLVLIAAQVVRVPVPVHAVVQTRDQVGGVPVHLRVSGRQPSRVLDPGAVDLGPEGDVVELLLVVARGVEVLVCRVELHPVAVGGVLHVQPGPDVNAADALLIQGEVPVYCLLLGRRVPD